MESARDAAVKLLLKIERDDSYSTLSLAEASEEAALADGREQALFTALVYGVIERRMALDYNIALYLTSPLKRLHPRALSILRVGALQLLYMDKIPDRAAVGEAVSQAKRMGVGFAASLVNAVLRKVAQNGVQYPPETDREKYLSVRYSCPDWLLRHFDEHYGADRTESILSAFEGRKALFLRLNPLKGEDVAARLAAEGLDVEPTPLAHCVAVRHTGQIVSLSSFREGLFHVQDLSSQICCKLLGARPGDTVVDCCAAPGGKTFTVAEYMNDRGVVYSNDIYDHKRKLIEDGAKRLGLTCVKTTLGDAADLPEKLSPADRVLCDAPCSGLGVIGRKPEIRYKSPEELEELPALQYRLLKRCAGLVKPGGTLLYSTCTLNPAENEDVCDRFLAETPGFAVSDDTYYRSLCGDSPYKTFFPERDGGDGFFTALFQRKPS